MPAKPQPCGRPNEDGEACTANPNHTGRCTRYPTLTAVLNIERRNLTDSRREELVRDTFGISMPRYLQIAHAHINTDEALAANPILVYGLRARREQLKQERAARARLTAPRKDQR